MQKIMKKWIKMSFVCFFVCNLLFIIVACGQKEKIDTKEQKDQTRIVVDTNISKELTFEKTEPLDYATEFRIDWYKEGYCLLTVYREGQYLVVPEGKVVPKDLEESITVIKRPLSQIYLVASAVMDMFVSLDGLEQLQFSGFQAEEWYIKEAREQMEQGKLLYAGKYATPDYELILSKGCDLAIENTMIYHSPKAKEELESFGIPVMVDYSSYEPHPLGRTEWVKYYGALLGKEDLAKKAFLEQKKQFADIATEELEHSKVAFFYVTKNNLVNVRKSSDYVPKMIALAGGRYVFDSIGEEEENASSSVSMQLEEFYDQAKDADYFLYNSTIEGEISTLDDFLKLNPLFENCKAVKEGHVYCTTKNLYQDSMKLGTFIKDLHEMLVGGSSFTYLYPLA